MRRFLAVVQIVVRRSIGNGRLLAMIVLGMLFASGLMAAVVIYSDAIRDLGLKHALASGEEFSLDLRVNSSSQPLRQVDYKAREERTETLVRDLAGGIIQEKIRYGRSSTFFMTDPGQPVPQADDRPRSHFQFVERLGDHVHLTAGKAPAPAPTQVTAGQAPAFEVLVGKATADKYAIQVGDKFDMHPFWREQAEPIHVTIAGIIEPNDPDEPYWFGADRMFEPTQSWPTYPFFVDERVFYDVLSVYLPDVDGTIETYGLVDLGSINSRNARDVQERLVALRLELSRAVPRTSLQTDLPETIQGYRDKLFFTRLPLFALMLQVVGIVLYYLVMVSTMVVERQTGEIALLKSRGASVLQIMGIYSIEGLILSLIATIAGPFLMASAISLLGFTPPFEELSHNSRLDVHLSPAAFMLAGLGAFLGMLALLVPAYRASQLSVVHYKTHMARPQRQPVFLRYYLDLVLIAVGAFAFYQLRQRGSLVTDKLFGDLSADPLLLATPTLFMLMIALLFLRLFPMALRVVSWAAKGLDGATIPLGLWHVVRSPLQYTRLILLLILATAVGMFAAGFGATLNRSYDDRAGYAAGADGRVADVRLPAGQMTEQFRTAVKSSTGAATVTPAFRMLASNQVAQFQSVDFDMLGIIPDELEDVAYWRGDFAGESLHSLLAKVVDPATQVLPDTVPVPSGTRYVGVWIKISLAPNQYGVYLRLRDTVGGYWEYRLATPAPANPNAFVLAAPRDAWAFYITDITRPTGGRPGPQGQRPLEFPLQFDSITLRTNGFPMAPSRASMIIDDVQTWSTESPPIGWQTNGFGAETIIESFESLERYEIITGASATADPGSLTRTEDARSGTYSAIVSWTWARGGVPLTGVRGQGTGTALPVLVRQEALDRLKKTIGDEITLYGNAQYLRVKVVGTFNLFPGFDPVEDEELMLADLKGLQIAATRVPTVASGAFPNEAWLDGIPGTPLTKEGLAAHFLAAEQVYDRAGIRAEAASDPLVAASWEGILFLSFIAVLVLTAIGFIVSSHLTAQTRSLEFAILRTMGFTGRQILSLVALEQCFVVAAGLVVGTLLGFPLVQLMIPYLGITEKGAAVLPPMASEVNWVAVMVADGLLLSVFVGTIISLALTYTRLAVGRTLRMGEL